MPELPDITAYIEALGTADSGSATGATCALRAPFFCALHSHLCRTQRGRQVKELRRPLGNELPSVSNGISGWCSTL